MKHLFKSTFLILGLMLITFGCQKDNFEDEQLEVVQEENAKNNLFKKGKLSDYGQVKDFVKTLKNNKHDGNMSFRTSMETSNAFVILENQDMAIHSGDAFNTYTIPIVKLEQPESTFSNLVVQFSVASDSTSAYILTYNPNPGYLEDYAIDDRTAFSGQVSYEPLDYDGCLDGLSTRQFCDSVHISYCNWEHGGGQGSTHLATHNCTPGYTWVETYQICDYSSGNSGGFETIEPPSGPSGGGGGGTTNGVNTGSSTSTLPANVVNEIVSILNLNELNDQAEINWLNNFANFSEVINMFSYLDVNKNSIGAYEQAALDFVEVALEALVDDGEVDYENEIIKDPTFIDTKADCVYELLSSTENNLFKDVLSAFTNNNSKFKLKFRIGNVSQGADGSTSYDSNTNIITITFPPSVNNLSSLEIAALILHEGIHAELRRIYEGNNQVLEPLPQAQYDYLVSLWEHYKGIVTANEVSNYASHTYMIYNHINPLASAIRELDDNHYSLDHYMWYGWDGLSDIGKNTYPQLLTISQEDDYQDLQQITINDLKKQSCDD